MTVVFVFSSFFLWTMSEWITHLAVVFCLMTAVSLFVLRKRRGWCRMFFFKHHFSILFPFVQTQTCIFWVFFLVVEIRTFSPQIPRWSGRSGRRSWRTGGTDRDGSGGSRAQGKRCELMWCEVMNLSPIFGGASIKAATIWWILRDFPYKRCIVWLGW